MNKIIQISIYYQITNNGLERGNQIDIEHNNNITITTNNRTT